MRPKIIPLPMVSIRNHMKKMVIFSVAPNPISLTVNSTSSKSSGDSESDMSDVKECRTKSEVKMKKSFKIDPHGAPSQVLLSKRFICRRNQEASSSSSEEESYIICITIEDHEKLEMKICIKQ